MACSRAVGPPGHAPRVPAINPAPPPAPGISGAYPGLKYTYFWPGFFAFRIYSSKRTYCIFYPSLPRFGSACMGCLLAAAPGPHPGLAGSSGQIAERSMLWGFSGMESLNIILFHFSRTRLDPYRPFAGSRSRSTCWPSGFQRSDRGTFAAGGVFRYGDSEYQLFFGSIVRSHASTGRFLILPN